MLPLRPQSKKSVTPRTMRISLFEMCMCLSNAMDLVSPRVVDHHKRVAYIASSIGAEIGLFAEDRERLLMAGLLHDIGAISLKDRIESLQFELEHPHAHAELGFRLVRTFENFADIAPLIRFHHLPWDHGRGSHCRDQRVPLLCHILHLADRIAVLINLSGEILSQRKEIVSAISAGSGERFVPEFHEGFLRLADKEYFWFDVVSPRVDRLLTRRSGLSTTALELNELMDLTRLFSRIIDFRSRFTATHSSGVAATAEALGWLAGLSRQRSSMLKIAGYLHDLGKLAIPAEILEKPRRLTPRQQNIIKNHPYYTHRIIENVRGLETINRWASFHHERLDGEGYPFHLSCEDLPVEARIMAVADVFTAIAEDRPYRQGMSRHRASAVLNYMTEDGALDPDLVSLLTQNYEEVNAIRMATQSTESEEYREFGLRMDM